MKYINPEQSCILDVGESRAEDLERAGWAPYIEEKEPATKAESKKEKNFEAEKKTAKKTNKDKKK